MIKDEEILQKFIEQKSDSINTIGITDPISEDYLKNMFEEYFELKTSLIKKTSNINTMCRLNSSVDFI